MLYAAVHSIELPAPASAFNRVLGTMSAEDKVLHLLQQHNKPFNTQAVADLLATQGVKKTAAQKALDALAEAGKIVAKVR